MLLLSCIAKYNIYLNLTSLTVSDLVDLILPPLTLLKMIFFYQSLTTAKKYFDEKFDA